MEEIESTVFYHTEPFRCTPQEFYRAMTTESTVVAFMLSGCKVDAKEGGKFELFDVEGHFYKLVPYKIIALKWRLKTWKSDHFSDVVIDIQQKSDYTEVHVVQYDIPKEEEENTFEAWHRIYWKNIRATFDYNTKLMDLIKKGERHGGLPRFD